MEDDPYEDDSFDAAEPSLQQSALSEVKHQVQKMLGQQLDTTVTREKQSAKSRSFTPAAITYRPFVEQASGQLSLADFKALEREHQGLEELQACGLTDEEIALKLEHEGRQLSCFIPPYKRGRFTADPVAQRRRLKIVEEKIQRKRASLGIQSQEAALSSHGQMEAPVAGIEDEGASGARRNYSTFDQRYVHPNDPINHLDAIAAGLFGQIDTDKQCGDAPPRNGNATSPVGQPSGGCSLGCPGDGCHAGKRRRSPNEDLPAADSAGASQRGLGVDGTRTSQDAATECGGVTPRTNLSNIPRQRVSPEAPTKPEISNCATGGSGAGRKSLSVSGVGEECSNVQSEDNEPRRLAGSVRPLSREDLLQYRLSRDDICKMERFRDYSPGQPSKVLYLKNLSSKVAETDLASVFVSFQYPDKPPIVFKLLTGRMRGQAFVTFSDAETAAEAMQHINGYPLRGKPVIIQYGKPR